MGKFSTRSAEKQITSVMRELSPGLKSIRTKNNYSERLFQVATNLKETGGGELRDLTAISAVNYLEQRGSEVGQKTLDMERQAIQFMMINVTGKLGNKEKLTVVKSEHKQVLNSRAYTSEQVILVSQAQTGKNQLATKLAYACGLRAHELLTITKAEEKPMSDRPALEAKFSGRVGKIYTVTGKGGLVREILVPKELVTRLEKTRLSTPKMVVDRKVNYIQNYNISGGQKWSNSFSAASNRVLGWSGGAHGLRHSYAQERMSELHKQGHTRLNSLEIVSQEIGHFRPEVTEIYLR
ncbi:MAG: site-specific integrase [Colwellia sp.]